MQQHEDQPVDLSAYHERPPTPGGKVYGVGFEGWLSHDVRLEQVTCRLGSLRIAAAMRADSKRKS